MEKKEISLLTQPPFELTLWGRLVNWLTTVGRFIIVFTELIVLGAFISRFWLDRKNSDLSEAVRQYRAILESSVDFEKEFRFLQARMKKAALFIKGEKELFTPLEVVARQIPDDIILTQFNFSSEKEKPTASISILVFSERSLANFINYLLTDPEVDSVRIGVIKKEKLVSGTQINLVIVFRSKNGRQT